MTPRAHTVEDLRWTFPQISDVGVDYGGGVFPKSFTARLSHPGWPCDADLLVAVDEERGPVAVGLVVQLTDNSEDRPNYREMHDLLVGTVDVKTLLREVAADAVGAKVQLHLLDEGEPPELAAQYRTGVRDRAYLGAAPRRRRLITRDYLEQVAQIYREALEAGDPPTQTVAGRLSMSHSNASKLVRKARDAGALGAAMGTRPGEDKP